MTQLGTPDICDQYFDQLQVALPVLQSFGGRSRVSAKMVTLKIRQDNAAFWSLLRQPGHGRVIVVDAGGEYCAVMGDKMADLAIQNDWKGVVIFGYIRDSAILKTLPLAVWALGTCPMKGTFKAEADIHVPLEFAGLRVNESQHLYADEDGLVVSRAQLEEFESHF